MSIKGGSLFCFLKSTVAKRHQLLEIPLQIEIIMGVNREGLEKSVSPSKSDTETVAGGVIIRFIMGCHKVPFVNGQDKILRID